MKPYGNSRRDNLSCKDDGCHGNGCCHTQRRRGAGYSPNDRVRRASKHRARQAAKKETGN